MSFRKYTVCLASLLFFFSTAIQPCRGKEGSFYEGDREGFYWNGEERPGKVESYIDGQDQEKPTNPVQGINNSKSIFDNQKEPYKAAERVAKQHESQNTKATVERYKRQLKSQVSKKKRDAYQSAAIKQKALNSAEADEILIFISSSMPPGLTRSFIKDANKLECSVKFVLNGYPKGGINSFVKTVNKKEDNFDLNIDPLLFDAYSVVTVPAMVINRSVKIKNPENTKSALVIAESATGNDYGDLIKNLAY